MSVTTLLDPCGGHAARKAGASVLPASDGH